MRIIKFFVILFMLYSYLSCQNTETKTMPVFNYSKAQLFVTSKDSDDRLAKKELLSFSELRQPFESDPTIIIDANKTFQTIEGFGGALTDASAETFYKLPVEKQQEFLTACFDPVMGNGYNLCRTNIHSCDFSSSSYTYA
ncbi:MAG: glycosyl hydrolase, partial [bacterium]